MHRTFDIRHSRIAHLASKIVVCSISNLIIKLCISQIHRHIRDPHTHTEADITTEIF